MTPAELTVAREALHLSQRKLAEVLGVHPNLVNRWERGHAKIPPYLHLATESFVLRRALSEACDEIENLVDSDDETTTAWRAMLA